ncbi:MAG: porphobilinogen synthase [Alphaproteobacteria bacterium]|nr:porphobilinogen synthase [Alphaproteobacteria bacterium]
MFYINSSLSFPQKRMRRNRSDVWVRDLVQENRLSVKDLILPLFVVEGHAVKEPVKSMPGVFRYSPDLLIEEIKKAEDLGIPAVALFPVIETEKKSSDGKEAYNPNNLLCNTLIKIKKEISNIGIITDVALDPYTTHGHDGIIRDEKINNDETLEALKKQALVQVKAGADIIAPSDMMDGRIGIIRKALDDHKKQETLILSYAAKYASSFYGPFRDAVQSGAMLKGDKKTYQMDSANANEALYEVALDIQEGADMVMIKPGMPYLDIITIVKQNFKVPTFAYQVSGEYAMLYAASENGWLDFQTTLMETMICFKRAGADAIFTYAAMDLAKWLSE